MKRLIVATGNAHKVEEFEILLNDCGFEVGAASICGGMPEVVEDGDSFAANARLKAIALHRLAPAGAWVVADDSGLEVDALDGAPGISSARYAGEGVSDAANVSKLIGELDKCPNCDRSARFRCVLCLIGPDAREQYFEGVCEGRITRSARGNQGFGYDPVFVPVGYDQTFGELGEGVKSQLSHRARAVAALKSSVT